ncbi:MAG: 3-phosphoshikimate 1-carboxyvinyltransferase [Bacteroidales bacterium]|nr:3-phosphoshikimate 1-carboxyvinyltransferase [Bacteroidales bacterium]
MRSIQVTANSKNISGEVSLPLSKSISNRALMISAISGGKVQSGKLSDADDTVLLKNLLRQIAEKKSYTLDAKNAGTVFRFLTAYLSITPGKWILDGDARMRHRPIGPLVDALLKLGAEIIYAGHKGYPPLKINGKPLTGKKVFVNSDTSSQFISALMMIAPVLPEGLIIELMEVPASISYIYLTAEMMMMTGVDVEQRFPSIHIPAGAYKKCILPAEADWSSAAFWYELMALSEGGQLFLRGLKEGSFQGDSVLERYFRSLGVETSYQQEGALITKTRPLNTLINFDLISCPDLAPAMIVTAAALGLEANFIELNSLRFKESDRLKAIKNELGKTGIKCTITEDSLSFLPQKMEVTQPVDTYHDHRIAMAFAPLAILGKSITVNDPGVVSKSYPGFWNELQRVLGVRC